MTLTDKLTIQNAFEQYKWNIIENFQFADNTFITFDDVKKLLPVINGTTGNNLISASAYNDTINGLAGNDTILGLAGDDIIDGGLGTDSLVGGTGNDTYYVDVATDKIIENSNEGLDSVISTVSYSLSANVENLSLTGTSNIYAYGNSQANVIQGNSGNNTLNGYGEADTLIGGAGNDVYYVDNILDIVKEDLTSGLDLVNASVSYSLSPNVENLILTGTSSINGTGNDLNNSIQGNSGTNTLDGGVGVDTLVGGTGNDTYIVDNVGDIVTETSTLSTEIDTVNSSISYSLGANLENLSLTSTSFINATGNALNNIITGNDGNNIITGGLGKDTMIGGSGDDTYMFNKGDKLDVITDSAGTDLIKFGNTVNNSKIAIFKDSTGKLIIDYGDTAGTDKITVTDWNNSSSQIEKVQRSDNYFVTNANINTILQDMSAYITSHSLSITTVEGVKGNTDLMNIINTTSTGHWHS